MLQALDKLSDIIKVAPHEDFPLSPSRQIGRFVYLPIEVASRELLAKCQLAKDLLRMGFRVVLGATWNLSCNAYQDLPPGIVLFKTLNALDGRNMRLAQEAGHLAIALDEEMFSLRPKVEWYKAVSSDNARRRVDMICASGGHSHSMFKEISDAKVEITGNPRCNMPRIDPGDDILVCTMAPVVNNAKGFPDTIKMIAKVLGKPIDGDLLEYIREKVVHEWAGLELLLDTVKAVADSFPNRTIRLRPHPGENSNVYNVADNVRLDKSDSFVGSLNGAAVMVFVSGCSTGIESFLGGIPSVRLGEGGHGFSCDLHLGASTSKEAVVAVESQLSRPRLLGDLSQHFSAITIAEKIDAMQRSQAGCSSASIEGVWSKRKTQVVPQDFTRRKFPDTSAGQITTLSGARSAKTIGWNTWLLS